MTQAKQVMDLVTSKEVNTGIDKNDVTGLYRAFVGGECFGLYHTAQEAHDRVAEIVNARVMAQA